MKVVIFDSWNGKFSTPIKEHWESLGHEVLFHPKWEDAKDADMAFFYQADNTLVDGLSKIPDVRRIYAQCVDIEVWAGQATAADWSRVNGVIFLADHIRNLVVPKIQVPPKIATIKPGINLEKFYLKTVKLNSDPIRRIAYVVGDRRIWDVKRFDIALMMLRDLLDTTNKVWQLHILGSYSTHEQYNDYCRHLIDSLELDPFLVWYDRQENVSEWLNDKDYFFLPSTKETFSYATAEAMAKGIKPVIGNWRGARETWGPYVNRTYKEMYTRLTEKEYEPEEYRKYVEAKYDEKRYLKDLDAFMELGGEVR